MSNVDNRIVRMQFDNAQFEAGISKSMASLDELTSKLQFKEAGKGISALQVALNGVDFSSITSGVSRLEHAFTSVTGMIGQRIKTDIVDQIEGAVSKLWNSTIGQAKSGGWSRAMNIANAQFTIEGLKYSWDEVRKAADYAVTDTAYGLDVAAKAASQLAASGVDFQKIIGKDGAGNDVTQMHKSLRAISGVAAMTNSSYEEISHVFTRIAGQGRVMAIDLNSIAARGINAAATLADALGTTEAEIRDMVSKGQIDFATFSEAMDNAFGDHAKEANKTFNGALSNMKAALSRIGAIFAQPVVDKTNTFFISLTSQIKKFQSALSDSKEQIVKTEDIKKFTNDATKAADKLGYVGKQKADYITKLVNASKKAAIEAGKTETKVTAGFATHFAEAWEAGVEAASKFIEILDTSWFKSVASFLDNIAVKATAVAKNISTAIDRYIAPIKAAEKAAKNATGAIKDNLELDIKDLDLLHRILKNEFGYTEKRWKALDDIYAQGDSGKTGKWLQGYMDQLARVGYNFEALGWTEEEFKKKQEEANKTEAERLKGMSAQELMINGIVQALQNYNEGMAYAKEITANVFKSIISFGTSALKVVDAIGFGMSESGLSFYKLAEAIAPLSEAFRELIEALEPTHNELASIMDTTSILSDFIYKIITTIAEVATKFIKFSAYVIKARADLKSLSETADLSPIESSALSVMRVLMNLANVIKNIAKSIGRIVKAIVKAFGKVFNPSGILGGVADFSDGLSLLSDKLLITEEAASVVESVFTAIFAVVQGVATAITRLIGSITGFISGSKRANTGITRLEVTLEKTEKVGKKSGSMLESLGKLFTSFYEKIKKVPEKLKTFWEALNQNEGVIHLKESLSKLWSSIKDAADKAIGPMNEGLAEFADMTGAAGETDFGILVNGIGVVADWIADFVDKLPTYGENIKNFVKDTIDDVRTLFESLHIGDIFKTLGEGLDVTFATNGDIVTRVKTFFTDIGNRLYEDLSKVDWLKVGKGSILAMLFASIFNVNSVLEDGRKLIKSIKDIPTTINKIFTNFNSLITTGKAIAKKMAGAYFILIIAKSILMIAGAVYLLSDIPQDKLKEGLAATTWIAIIILMLAKALQLATTNLNAAGSIANSNNVSQTGISIVNNFSGLFTTLIGVAVVLGGIYLLMKGFGDLATKLDTLSKDTAIGDAVKSVLMILGMALVLIVTIAIINRVARPNIVEVKSLQAIGVAMAGIGVAVWLIADAMARLNGVKIKAETVTTVIGILSSVVLLMIAIGYAAQSTDWKSIIAVAGLLIVVTGVLAAICVGLVVLTGIITGLKLANQLDTFAMAVGTIGLFMIIIGASVMLMLHYLKDVPASSVLSVAVVISAIAVAMLLISASLGMVTKTLSGNDPETAVLAICAVLAALVVMMVAVAVIVAELKSVREMAWKRLLAVAAIIAAIGVCAIALGEAAKLMSQASLGGIIAMCVTIVAILGLVAVIIYKLLSVGSSDVTNGLYGLAAVMLSIGAAMLLFAYGISLLANFDAGKIAIIAVVIGVIIAALGGLAFVVAKYANGEEFKKVAMGILAIGAAFLLVGVGMYLGAKAMELIVNISGKLAVAIGELATAIEGHAPVFIGVVLTALAISAVLALLVVNFIPFVTAVTRVVDLVATVIARGIATISTILSTSTTRFTSWWNSATPKMKTMFVGLIVTLCAALVKASPEVLNTVKTIIIKVIKFIVDIIPTLVDGLVDIIIKLLNALADKIRAESARIAYAFWNVIEALVEVLIDVLVEGLTLVLNALSGLPGVGEIFTDAADALQGVGKTVKAGLRQGLESAQEYAQTFDDITDSTELAAAGSEQVGNAAKSAGAHGAAAIGGLASNMGLLSDNTATANSNIKEMDLMTQAKLAATTEAMNKLGDDVPAAAKNAFVNSMTSSSLPAGYLKQESKSAGVEIGTGLGEGTLEGYGDTLDAKSLFGAENPAAMLTDVGFGEEGYANAGTINGEAYNESMIDGVSDADGFYDAEQENMKGANQAVKDAKKKHVDTVKEYINDPGVAIIRGARPRYESAIEYCVDGIVAAAKQGGDEVEKAMQELAERGYIGFIGPKGLDENSPSKKTYSAGIYAVMGFINAINNQEGLVGNTMSGLSNTVIDSFGNPMDYVARMASGEIVYDPSIRPVLDTTAVARGAYGINSLFNNQNVTLSGLSGQLAADIGQLESRNSDVINELQAIREEMSGLSDDIQQMQIVMDTGALVGSMAGPMDKAMGRRAVYKGRGN